ncbi:ATP-binding protein [Actinophytocola xanthii]|uniref:ATP-binding protein n=1 Tax=Actinophytocola xanthii TaxID=1912961 RepID=A0A1Q8CQ85_9PSEU|nr:ATP-binding protein [Actinophytocola xanthii]
MKAEVSVEVKVGVADTARELVLNSTQTPDEIESLVAAALKDSAGTLSITDDKGRRYVVPSARIAYVEIGTADSRRVGFAT